MPSKIPFCVVHASGEDEVYKAVELNTQSPTTRGWQSKRFCLYPQDIVIYLKSRCRLHKIQILSHQYLIATKIEFYVGDVPDGVAATLQNARYTRLGYVALSDNEKTSYKARELKSVHVDAVGVFVKFVIHKSHINRHNLYNQVGIVALNVIGDVVNKEFVHLEREVSTEKDTTRQQCADYISPLDDLAFDMYQDPEVAQIIRKLEARKKIYVNDEKYEEAKKIKDVVLNLQKIGEKLGKFEVEKRQAVEGEDYEKAQLKKIQMDEYRLQVYKELKLNTLLQFDEEMDSEGRPDSVLQSAPVRLVEISVNKMPESPRTLVPDDRPLPAIKRKMFYFYFNSSAVPVDNIEDTDVEAAAVDIEAMTEKDKRDAAVAIECFEIGLVAKAYSKSWSQREDALLDLYRQLTEMPPDTSRHERHSSFKGAFFLANRAVKDPVYSVFTAGVKLVELLFSVFLQSHKVSKPEITSSAEKILSNLIQRTGDSSTRFRDAAKELILRMATFPEANHVALQTCCQPFKQSVSPRYAVSRCEIVEALYDEHGLEGLTMAGLMSFCTAGLQHNSGDVRTVCENIIVNLYRKVGKSLKSFLPPDDAKHRKNVLYKQIFEAFDVIDKKTINTDGKSLQNTEQAKKRETENKLHQSEDKSAASKPSRDDRKSISQKGKKKDKRPQAAAKPSADLEKVCIFCLEKNEKFTKEGLDIHYYKSCPMLQKCKYCKQVVEISVLTNHLLTNCNQSNLFVCCAICSAAIIKSDLESHQKSIECRRIGKGESCCPLCSQHFPAGNDDGWKEHLIGAGKCPKNFPNR